MHDRVNVLLISALPPPWGGVSTLTAILMRRGLPEPFELHLLDTSIWPRRLFEPASLSIKEIGRNIRILSSLISRLISHKADIVHFNWTPSRVSLARDFLIVFLCHLFAMPVALHFHGDFSKFDLAISSGISRLLFLGTLKRATCLLVLSMDSLACAQRRVPNLAVEFVPNFAECPSGLPIREFSTSDQPLKVLFVGGLCPSKGIFELLEAASLTNGVNFRLIGEPINGLRQQIEAFIIRNDLKERVEILGPLPNEEVHKFMLDSDAFCLPSHEEGFPICVLEAMCRALPVAATRVGNIPEMIVDKIGGFLFEPGDVRSLAAALQTLRDDPVLRKQMGEYNHQRVAENYEYKIVTRKLINVYTSLLAARRTLAGRFEN